jgi:hypothetical protein
MKGSVALNKVMTRHVVHQAPNVHSAHFFYKPDGGRLIRRQLYKKKYEA